MASSNRLFAAAIAGAAGAVAVNVVHELTRKTTPVAPRMDVVGMRALAGVSRALGHEPPERLRSATLAADLASNSLFYGLVGLGDSGNGLLTGGVLGAAAGIGGVLLPPRMGLGDAEVRRTPQTQALTVAFYLLGGLVAGMTYRALSEK